MSAAQIVAALYGSPAGLSTAEAAAQLQASDPNRLPAAPQEGKMLVLHAHCRRDGRWVEIDAADLIPGDQVRLRAGDQLPADLRLREAANLRIDESALTDESIPADKGTAAVDRAAGLGDLLGMAYSGTLVAAGPGLGVVTGTGPTTELGRINRMIADVETLATPLTRQIAAFGRVTSFVILAMAVGMFLIDWLLHDFPVGELVMAAIGFAVAAIPDDLPAVLTITLALGVQQMARRNVIIRRLPAVETLGAVTVICTDKTGTLTRNEMTVRHLVTGVGRYNVTGIGYAPQGHVERDGQRVELAQAADLAALVEVLARCNDAEIALEDGHWMVIGEPTEGALRTLACKLGFERGTAARLAVIFFDSRHKSMVTLQQVPDAGLQVLLKCAPGPLLERCALQCTAEGGSEPLDHAFWVAQIDALSAQGLRVLAAAAGRAAADQVALTLADLEQGLRFLGLVGIGDQDPVGGRERRATAPHRPALRLLRTHQPGAQAAPGPGAPGQRRGRRHDRRRGQRRPGAQARRRGRSHGHQGDRGDQGGGGHRAGR